jgi:4-aminobutyrate aminotransferase-like enzyme
VPHPAAVRTVLAAALERRLMLLSAGSYGNVVRIIPPLVTTADEVGQALDILDQAFAVAS